ncbi:MAG: hypothetical protein Q4A65_07385 [Bacillota bacterium]|nr:hypothetical protein [Bacillota bacterium]
MNTRSCIHDGETELVEDTGYIIEYANNKNVGGTAVTVTKLGDYGSALECFMAWLDFPKIQRMSSHHPLEKESTAPLFTNIGRPPLEKYCCAVLLPRSTGL